MIKVNKKGKVVKSTPEEELQMKVIQWRDEIGNHKWPELRWLHHAANGGQLAGKNQNEIKRNGARRRMLGVVKGIPDLFLAYNNGLYPGLYIELKVGNNNPSPEQIEYREFVTAQGYAWWCLNDFDAIIGVIESYMSYKRDNLA